MTDEGLQYTTTGGYYTDDGNYCGIIFNEQVSIADFSVEFTVEKVAGDASAGDDLWIGVHLLSKKAYFSVSDPAQSQGVVSLLRPAGSSITAQTFQHVDNFQENNQQNIAVNPVGNYKVEFKKNADTTYTYYLNGTPLETSYNLLSEAMPD